MVRKITFRWALRWISVILLLLTGSNLIAQQVKKVSPAGTKYLLYTPPGYNPSQAYPLLIVLHGQGGMGDNLDLLLNKDEIPSRLIHQNRWPSRYPFIVVSPQLKRDPSVPDPADQLWPPQVVDEVVEHVRSGYAVNASKIYITGLSQGAHGSYDYTTAFPSKIAAAVYISGVPDSTKACLVKDIPIWIFHGTDDSLVPPVFAYGLKRNLEACRGKFNPHLNMLYGRRHEGWNEIYNNTNGFNIFDWMLKFTKNSPANTPPYANAGADLTIETRQQPLHVYGEFFDSDGEIANVRWTKVSGPAVTMSDTDSRFLKLTDLTPGQFEFELTVTDDDGARTSDRVRITIVANNSVSPAVTGLTLLDGTGAVLAASLYDGYVIDPARIGRRGVNLRAHVSGSVGSVQYRINSNANARISDNQASDFPLAAPRWTLNEEEYLVCATPFTGPGGTGSAGASQCFKIVFSATATQPPPPAEEPPVEEPPVEEPPVEEPPVEEPPVEEPPVEEPPVEEPPVEEPPVEEPPVEEPPVEEPPVEEPPVEEPPVEEPPIEEPPVEEPPVEEPPAEEPPVEEPPVEEPPVEEPPVEVPPAAPTVFYARPGSDISLLASWSSNATGTGTAPASFTTNGQTFEVRSEAVLNNPLAIGGVNSVLRIVSGGKLALNNKLQSQVTLVGQAMLHIAAEHVPAFQTLDPQSTVTFAANATIPAAVYGNLILAGNGTAKNLSPGETSVKGTFTLSDGVKVEGNVNGSTLILSGDVALMTTGPFVPTQRFALVFNKPGLQKLTLHPIHLSLLSTNITPGTTLDVITPSKAVIELGSANGGGLTVQSGGKLLLKNNDLFISGAGTLNGLNETGQIAFRQSSLTITSSAAANSNLYTVPGSDTLSTLTVNLSSTGELALHSPLFISQRVTPINGTTQSNGFLTLVSTAENTAHVSRTEGSGQISGEVVFQRFIGKGKTQHYITLPVSNVSVADLQRFVAIRGNFAGGSQGNPSLHEYDEERGGWVPFPQSTSDELFIPGTGYWLSSFNQNANAKIVVSGPLQQGDFVFPLSPNPQNDPLKGWNLIGNPYAAPIEWTSDGWTREAVSAASYVYDGEYPGGRFLVWDGEVGDREFAGSLSQAQGFFVRTTSESPKLIVHESAKSDSASHFWRAKRTQSHSGMMVVALKQLQLIDRSYVKFSKSGADIFEESDAVKRKNGYFSVYTLSEDSVSLAINHLGESFCDRAISLIAEAPPGQYSLIFDSLAVSDLTVNLRDRYTGEVISISQGTEYRFEISTDANSSARNRFAIELPAGTLDPVITVEENVLSSNIASGNQWYLDGAAIEGATGQTLTAEASGEYMVVATSNGCTKTSEPLFVTVTVTAIKETHTWDVDVYPNPASDVVKVRFRTGATGALSYAVHNALGMMILRGTLDNSASGTHAIDVSGLSSGVYFLNVEADGWRHRIRFVISSAATR